MSVLLDEIKIKIKKYKSNEETLCEITSILDNEVHLLEQTDIDYLEKEKIRLDELVSQSNLSLSEKYNNFIYSEKDIKNAPDISWHIEDILPYPSLGVLIGNSGVGKTTLSIKLCKIILEKSPNTVIFYIDGDMSISKLKEHGIAELLEKYRHRFTYAGKSTQNFSKIAQNLLRDIVLEQKKNPDKDYIVFEDSLTLTAVKKRGFIDTELLYKNEKEIIEQNGTVVILHHTNKSGVFADSQHIENFADYTYLLERNDFNSSLLLHTQKASRFDIKNKAFKIEDRKILEEIDYETANISSNEVIFIKYITDFLEDDEANQSEIMRHLEKIRFFSEFKTGQKKCQNWLKKWAKNGKWSYEQRVDKKNAIFYFLNKNIVKEECNTEKLAKLNKLDKEAK
ncbi:hypothetical protein GA417_05585 [Poseidonibacter ostreae]|uniref:ATP-binding protein n=1 Tax=Poseidonibacter ostreae TaxID=2654171 RepID=UPI001264E960|nr:ATP-binding protein [Poseidonibacter ostreae]KAB7886421.1 hypothetical protein GA417_05585 [Poseidonibacter ostreae]